MLLLGFKFIYTLLFQMALFDVLKCATLRTNENDTDSKRRESPTDGVCLGIYGYQGSGKREVKQTCRRHTEITGAYACISLGESIQKPLEEEQSW